MKGKISRDIFFYMMIISILPIFLIYLLNATLLDSYSLNKKKEELHKISTLLTEGDGNINIPRLKRESNIEVYFLNMEDRYQYRIDDDVRGILDDLDWADVEIGANIEKVYQKEQGINLLVNITKITNQMFLVITTPVSSVENSVKISREFYYYSFFLVAFLSLAVSYIFSNKVSKPIIRLEKNAKNISRLNFDEKVDIKTGNELESLGESINTMSEKLESAIGNLKNANTQLEIDLENERKLEIMRRSFISSVNHELKTPLAIMRVYAEGLLEGVACGEEIEEYCSTIVEEVENMEKIVKELLYFSEIEAGYKKAQMESFRIDSLVENVLENYSYDFKEKKVKLNFLLKNEEVYGDIKLVERVLENFFSNAVTYVPENGEIKITGTAKDGFLKIRIYNSGDKIPEDKINDIWKPFFKLDKARTRKYGGTGLGLSIVKKILDIHNSDYGVHNLADGVEFFFTLKKS
ncbi:sensor histidine kinase [Ilyobacter polytropus]|uniref:histidine kinase n=1 Tax=Ilyobacter polytropus (strain ATCC 51220 / DSM 2926 / LMG 16218 / CuHBu1) TaxID=572544 RepID=E3HDU5_ILYPC|nr:sensor histidine kinase [Ilyobacter polytropus]ADO84281.1 integral membrane sensor signal transduction histidine kinase [Ilyobacter polytropus DSM 2926]